MSRPVVYRCYGDTSRLLCIGSTGDEQKRFQVHQTQTPWWSEVTDIKTEVFPSLPDARTAERAAIRAEQAPYNKIRYRHPSRPRKPHSGPLLQHQDRLRWRRVAAGLSLKMLAQKVGCSATHLSNLENRAHPCNSSRQLLAKIADALGCEIADLVAGEPDGTAAA